ncbi:MAG: class I SAM-dependent methyltransferase [Bacteroidota bacterium]
MDKSSEYYKLSRPEVQNFLPESFNSLLDVGCGYGNFGREVKEAKKCLVWGIEPEEKAYNEANKQLDKAFLGTFEDAYDKIENNFDVITFNDVLEHTIDPWSILAKTKTLLSENGIIVSSIPNILHFYAIKDILLQKDWQYAREGIMDKTHLRFFTKRSMVRMFEESGLEVIKIVGINPVVSRGAWLLSTLSFGYYDELKYPQFLIMGR